MSQFHIPRLDAACALFKGAYLFPLIRERTRRDETFKAKLVLVTTLLPHLQVLLMDDEGEYVRIKAFARLVQKDKAYFEKNCFPLQKKENSKDSSICRNA